MPPDIDQHSFFATNAIFFLPLKTSCQDDCLTLAKKKLPLLLPNIQYTNTTSKNRPFPARSGRNKEDFCLRPKISDPSSQHKPGIAVCVCHPSYMGGISRRTADSQAKKKKNLKNN
jgi:hypothetical protein